MKMPPIEEDFSPLNLTESVEFDYVEISDGRVSLFFPRLGYLLPIEQHDLKKMEVSDPEVQYDMRQLYLQIQSDFDLSEELAQQVMAERITVADAIRKQRKLKIQEATPNELNGSKNGHKGKTPVVTVVDTEEEPIPAEWEQKTFISQKYAEIHRRMYLKAAEKESEDFIDTVATLFLRRRRLYHIQTLVDLPITSQPVQIKARSAISLAAGDYIKFGNNALKVAQIARKDRTGKINLILIGSDVEIPAKSVGFVADYSNDLEVRLGYPLWSMDHTLKSMWLGGILKTKIYDFFMEEREAGEKKLLLSPDTLSDSTPPDNKTQQSTPEPQITKTPPRNQETQVKAVAN